MDHTEIVQIDFHPKEISFAEILDYFGTFHNPFSKPWSSQYDSLILYSSELQKKLALAWREKWESEKGQKIHTRIEPLDKFCWAEDYHQKYFLQRVPPVWKEWKKNFSNIYDFANSYGSMILNSYFGGFLGSEFFDLLHEFDFSEKVLSFFQKKGWRKTGTDRQP